MSGNTGTTISDHGVSLERAATETDGGLSVTLEARSESDAPVVVWIEDDLPEGGRPVGFEGDETGSMPAGGVLEATLFLPPGATETLSYRVSMADGRTDERLSAPRIATVVSLDRDATAPSELRSVWWVGPAGRSFQLADVETRDPTVLDEGPEPADRDGRTTNGSAGQSDTGESASPQVEDRPAIGIIARPADSDGIYRTALEARRRGFEVFLTPLGEGLEELTDILSQIGVEVVHGPDEADWQTLRSHLSAAARAAGHPGIVLQPEGCPRIDYDRTLSAFDEDGFEMYAVPERPDAGPGTVPLLVGIPAYNAADSIGSVVREAREFADEVLVVDDGSTDGTAERAREAGATVIVHPRNRGYGGALKTIFEAAREKNAAHLVTIDADGQHDPGDIPRLVATQEDSSAGVVIASRHDSDTEVPFVRSIGLWVVNRLTNASMGRYRAASQIRDTQSGFRAYTADAVTTLVEADDIGDGMWASTDILYATNDAGFDFHEINTTIRYDVAHGSTEGAASHGFGLVRNIVGFFQRTHPIAVLGVPGTVLILAGAFAVGWWLQGGATAEAAVPTLAVSTLSITLGLVLLLLGVTLHVLNTHPYFKKR